MSTKNGIFIMDWKNKWNEFKLDYLTIDPGVNIKNKDSRQNWILFMANKTERYPVRKVYDRFIPTVTKMTVNTDFRELEDQGLIKREKESDKRSYIVPLFEDSGEAPEPVNIRRKRLALNYGLPILAAILLVLFILSI